MFWHWIFSFPVAFFDVKTSSSRLVMAQKWEFLKPTNYFFIKDPEIYDQIPVEHVCQYFQPVILNLFIVSFYYSETKTVEIFTILLYSHYVLLPYFIACLHPFLSLLIRQAHLFEDLPNHEAEEDREFIQENQNTHCTGRSISTSKTNWVRASSFLQKNNKMHRLHSTFSFYNSFPYFPLAVSTQTSDKNDKSLLLNRFISWNLSKFSETISTAENYEVLGAF